MGNLPSDNSKFCLSYCLLEKKPTTVNDPTEMEPTTVNVPMAIEPARINVISSGPNRYDLPLI